MLLQSVTKSVMRQLPKGPFKHVANFKRGDKGQVIVFILSTCTSVGDHIKQAQTLFLST